MSTTGRLFVVATPIGNLEDITRRGIETLLSVDLILAEDTRQTGKLLKRYEIGTPMQSYHQHSDVERAMAALPGKDVALVTDSGTPAISDPGSRLVRAARELDHEVIPIPGPAAVTAALSAAGLGGDRFTFLGFLPHKKGRQTALNSISGLVMPVVLYESPRRLVKLLGELAERYPQAETVVARELTKLHEEFRSGTPGELNDWYSHHPPKGEVVVIVKA